MNGSGLHGLYDGGTRLVATVCPDCIIAGFPQCNQALHLQLGGLLARPLEFYEQRSPAEDQEQNIWPAAGYTGPEGQPDQPYAN
jgi:hypothetical protein